ncbi:SH3 domain-containing protein [Leptolyngbya sp. FACHB-17]|uniref:SH3 domain-containing protein n=1 Tax=unclassified Leptolyngbya TaxID=2650499 RepID=UPI0016813D90|nr:SH3 domain-containing protein [Leptolyngbya sp. FACHB-17]MBD2083036.1 hypothetical protein [Leptolyngbya sp. FACHB-17]
MEESIYAGTITTGTTSKLVRLGRSLKKWCLNIPSSAWVGFAGFILATSVLVTHVPSAQAAQYVRVSNSISALNVRNGPGSQYGLNGRPLYPGETVRVVASSNGWYQLPDGGWFSSAYTTSSNIGGPGPIGTPTNQTVRATTTVNVRNGPGVGYGLNGRPLYPGETVRVIRQSGGWYQLPDGGWFSSAYTTSPNTGGPGPIGTPTNQTVRATTTVNVRNGPGVGYGLNGRPLYPGETVRVIRQSGGWYQLPDGGWFSSAYTTSPNTGGPGVSSATVSTNGGSLLIRSSPSGSVIGSLSNGSVVRLSGRVSGGYSQLSSGGWVSSSWLR